MKRRKFLRNSFLTGAAAIAGTHSFAKIKNANDLKDNNDDSTGNTARQSHRLNSYIIVIMGDQIGIEYI